MREAGPEGRNEGGEAPAGGMGAEPALHLVSPAAPGG